VYRTADDRFVTVGALEPKFYALLLERLGLDPADWPQHDTARWSELRGRVEAIVAAHPLAHWVTELEGTDACFGAAVTLDELTTHPHLVARDTYLEVDGAVQAAPAPRFSRTPGAIHRPPPWPGEHTRFLLEELGIAEDRLDALFAFGIVADVAR
jgi:alpha-methylacyl-CoA racemase